MDIITFNVPNNKQSDDKDVSSQPPAPAEYIRRRVNFRQTQGSRLQATMQTWMQGCSWPRSQDAWGLACFAWWLSFPFSVFHSGKACLLLLLFDWFVLATPFKRPWDPLMKSRARWITINSGCYWQGYYTQTQPEPTREGQSPSRRNREGRGNVSAEITLGAGFRRSLFHPPAQSMFSYRMSKKSTGAYGWQRVDGQGAQWSQPRAQPAASNSGFIVPVGCTGALWPQSPAEQTLCYSYGVVLDHILLRSCLT